MEKNIRHMVEKLHRARSPEYLALLGGAAERRPSNLEFLRALARALEAGERP